MLKSLKSRLKIRLVKNWTIVDKSFNIRTIGGGKKLHRKFKKAGVKSEQGDNARESTEGKLKIEEDKTKGKPKESV